MQRRVAQEFVDVWDAWLQESLHATRQRLGESWLEAYLTSPVWRFLLAEGVCGGQAYAGVMVPSVDRVGRYFPLAILAPLGPGSCLLDAAGEAGRSWFNSAESLALGALEAGDLDLDAFDAAVEALEALDGRPELAQSSQLMELMAQSGFASGRSPWHVSMPGETPQRAANAFASIELERAFRPCALWWTQGSDAVQPGWLVSRGLPPPGHFAALLTGGWREVGWNTIELERRDEVSGVSESPLTGAISGTGSLEITVAHPPPRRDSDIGVEPRFVSRPEIGLWGIVCAPDGASATAGDAARSEGLDLISDGAHDLAPHATLTALVEETRRMLQRTRTFRGNAGSLTSSTPGALFLLAQEGECALVWVGAMQAVRIRSGTAVPLIVEEPEASCEASTESVADPALETPSVSHSAGAEEGSLLALLTSAAPLTAAVPGAVPAHAGVRYERLHATDLWLLGTAAALEETRVREIACASVEEAPEARDPAAELEPLLSPWMAGTPPGATPAVMLLKARTSG